MIRTFTGREVVIERIGPEVYWRTGEPIATVRDRQSGEVFATLKSRLRATGGQAEIDAAIRQFPKTMNVCLRAGWFGLSLGAAIA